MPEPLIFEISSPGRVGFSLPDCDVPETDLPDGLMRREVVLPEVCEPDVIRHYTRLSQYNFGVDLGMYPLGSCTMKYNPKVNETAAQLPGFAGVHPYQAVESQQGILRLLFELQTMLGEIAGLPGVTLDLPEGASGLWPPRSRHGADPRQRPRHEPGYLGHERLQGCAGQV
jgi:glycine dehydrogenase subunit 2